MRPLSDLPPCPWLMLAKQGPCKSEEEPSPAHIKLFSQGEASVAFTFLLQAQGHVLTLLGRGGLGTSTGTEAMAPNTIQQGRGQCHLEGSSRVWPFSQRPFFPFESINPHSFLGRERGVR